MNSEITTAYIGLGSNLGDRAGNLLLGVRGLMEASFSVNKLSAIYETEPVGFDEAPYFLNMVAEIKVAGISPSQMMARMLRIEYLLERNDKTLKRPRTIDLDLLFYGLQKVDTPFITVPHPRLHLRNFVLTPMNEIAPDFIHPRLKKSMRVLKERCADPSTITRWNPNRKAELQAAEY